MLVLTSFSRVLVGFPGVFVGLRCLFSVFKSRIWRSIIKRWSKFILLYIFSASEYKEAVLKLFYSPYTNMSVVLYMFAHKTQTVSWNDTLILLMSVINGTQKAHFYILSFKCIFFCRKTNTPPPTNLFYELSYYIQLWIHPVLFRPLDIRDWFALSRIHLLSNFLI